MSGDRLPTAATAAGASADGIARAGSVPGAAGMQATGGGGGGGQITYTTYSQTGASTTVHTWLMNADGTNRHKIPIATDSVPGNDWEPYNWTADGSRLVLADNGGNIAVFNAHGSGQKTLPIIGQVPSFFPDGSHIAYEGARTGFYVARFRRFESEEDQRRFLRGELVAGRQEVLRLRHEWEWDRHDAHCGGDAHADSDYRARVE